MPFLYAFIAASFITTSSMKDVIDATKKKERRNKWGKFNHGALDAEKIYIGYLFFFF